MKREAVSKREAASADRDFVGGQSFGYYEVLDLMVQQAETFGLRLVDLALDGFDPDTLMFLTPGKL